MSRRVAQRGVTRLDDLSQLAGAASAEVPAELTTLPKRMSKKQIVRILKERWRTERAYEELKRELGLDHFEGRSFTGWHHHISVVLCCYAFVVGERVRRYPPPLGDWTAPSRRRARSRGLNATSRIRSRPRALPSLACSSAGYRGARYAWLERPFARRPCLRHSLVEDERPSVVLVGSCYKVLAVTGDDVETKRGDAARERGAELRRCSSMIVRNPYGGGAVKLGRSQGKLLLPRRRFMPFNEASTSATMQYSTRIIPKLTLTVKAK